MVSKIRDAQPSSLSKKQISLLAESVALQLGYHFGDELTPFVEKLGGRIEVRNTLAEDPKMSGSLYVEKKGRFTIIVPAHTSITRDNFTISHELGHYIIHYLYNNKVSSNLGSMIAYRKGSQRVEWEANWFAAAFLMPSEVFLAKYEKVSSIDLVAKDFAVSPAAAKIRLQQLGRI